MIDQGQGATGLDLVIPSGLELIILIRHVNGPSEKETICLKKIQCMCYYS